MADFLCPRRRRGRHNKVLGSSSTSTQFQDRSPDCELYYLCRRLHNVIGAVIGLILGRPIRIKWYHFCTGVACKFSVYICLATILNIKTPTQYPGGGYKRKAVTWGLSSNSWSTVRVAVPAMGHKTHSTNFNFPIWRWRTRTHEMLHHVTVTVNLLKGGVLSISVWPKFTLLHLTSTNKPNTISPVNVLPD